MSVFLSLPTKVITMKKILGLLLMMGLMVSFVGCATTKPHVEYWFNGLVKKEGNYKGRKKDGRWVEYHSNGLIKKEEGYKDGEWNGKWVMYYENGKIKSEENYKAGKREGKKVDYDEEGNITRESCYEMGEGVDCPSDE